MTNHKTLKRSRKDRIINGTCGGLAEYFNIPAGLLRIGMIILFIIGMPYVVTAYILSWFCISSESKSNSKPSSTSFDGFSDSELDREFDTLDKSLSHLEKKLARLEDMTIKRNSF